MRLWESGEAKKSPFACASSRLTLIFVMAVMVLLIAAASKAYAKTYYIAANGSDSNNGTSNTTPWLHAPGMPNCSSVCASTTPQAGDQFIFRGGDVWHTSNSALSPYTGNVPSCNAGTCGWDWSWSGTAGNCDFPTTTSSCIYIGVDTSWYSGGSFSRPKINLDNPTWANSSFKDSSHTGWVTQCSYNDAAFTGWNMRGNYVIVDNFEFVGKCWSSLKAYNADTEFAADGSKGDVLEHSYFHGWTETYSGGRAQVFDKAAMIGGTGSLWILTYSVFDGADAGPPCNASGNCSGDVSDPSGTMGIQNWDHNIFRRIANTTNGTADVRSVHDNLFEYMYDSFDATTHSDVFFTYGNYAPTGTNVTFYNNMLRHVSTGQTLAIDPPDAGQLHFFNNIVFDVGNSGNCMQLQNTTGSDTAVYITNNTYDAPCTIAMDYNNNLMYLRDNFVSQNHHFVGWTSLSQIIATSGNPYLTVTDNGNEVFQAQSAANGQGYTSSNNYQPTSTSGATYQAGANLSSSCVTYSSDSALCSGSTGGVTNTEGSGNIPTPYIASPPARGTAWDAGAYQYSTTQPNPPTGLIATVQ